MSKDDEGKLTQEDLRAMAEGDVCDGRFCDVPDSPLCTCPPDVKEANKKKYSSFEKAWKLVKAAPCPQCGAETGERCGKNNNTPANKCKLRRRSMEGSRDSAPSTWKE